MKPAFLALTLIMVANGLQAADSLQTSGTIDAVTVYRGQALVTRLVEVPGPAGAKEIVVTGLPDQVEPGSIYAESTDGIEVRSVSYSSRPVEKDVREEVQKLDDQIRAAQDKLDAIVRRHQLLQEQKDYLNKLEQFVAGTSAMELTKGVLNADTLKQLTQFSFTERSRISEEDLKSDLETRDLNTQLQTFQRLRGQVATSSSKVAREARVLVNLLRPAGTIRLRYVVGSATWLPSYNIRVAAARNGVTVEYLASIQQLSGEDWSNVQMTLSTATPSLVSKAPLLNELAITSGRAGQPGTVNVLAQIEQSGGSEQARFDLQQQRLALEAFRQTIGNTANTTTTIAGTRVNLDYIGDNNDVDLILNKTAGDLQLVDLVARGENFVRSRAGKPAPLTVEQGLAITYQVTNRTSLLSRSDRQLIQIASIPLKAQFYKVASPVLATYVYDEATVVNDSLTAFLFGDVATYVNNEFVGRGVIPSVATGQSFNVGLGIDSSLRARRELVQKEETTQGANRVTEFTYRLSLENFAAKPANVRLFDRLPTAKESEIKVTLAPIGKEGKELSKDAIYEQDERKKGILRWDIEVPAQAVEVKALNLEYQFKLEYAANVTISAPATSTGTGAGAAGGAGGRGGGGAGRGAPSGGAGGGGGPAGGGGAGR